LKTDKFRRFGIAPEGGAFVATRKKSHFMPKEKEEFAAEKLATVDAIIQRHKGKQGALIPVLEEVQEAVGYLPKSIQGRVARGLKIPFSEVYGVVTFYSFFTMAPRGKHTVRCCLGTACYVRGGKKILESLTKSTTLLQGSSLIPTSSSGGRTCLKIFDRICRLWPRRRSASGKLSKVCWTSHASPNLIESLLT
jgi:NADH:ubiquinone oxidoreductase subunit E